MKIQRLNSLDCIRGIAAISVFLSHFGNSKLPLLHELYGDFQSKFLWCNGGLHWGVVVFVVLSGFSIHMQYVNTESFDINLFFKRRLLRIYPVLIFAILLGFIVDNHFYHRHILEYVKNFLANGLLLTAFFPIQPILVNGIMHTAIVEVVIYILYPTMFRFFKKNPIAFYFVLLVMHFLNFGLNYFQIDGTWIGRNVFSLLLYWWIGAFFAEFTFTSKKHFTFNKQIYKGWFACILGYGLYLSISHLINFQGAHIFKSILLAILSGMFISSLVDFEIKNNYKRFFGLQYLGLVSYSLYAIHIPIVFFINSSITLQNLYKNNLYYIIWVSVIGMTFLTYMFIEKPFHKMARS